MEVKPKLPTVKGQGDWFTGDVWIDSVVQPHEHSSLNVGAVHFPAPRGTRTTAGRRCMSPKARAASSPEASRSPPSGPATSCTRPRVSGTGTAPHRTTS